MDAFFDIAPCFYFSFTNSGMLTDVNQTLCAAIGYTKEELKDQKVELLFPIATKIFYETHLSPLLTMEGNASELFVYLKTKTGGQLPVLMNATREEKGEITLTQCVCILVHNRKKFENELIAAKNSAQRALVENESLEKAKAELAVQAETLEAQLRLVKRQNDKLRQFTFIASHNLQEPLRKTFLFSELLVKDISHEPGTEDNLLRLRSNLKSLDETIKGLQKYIRLTDDILTFQHVDLGALISKIKNELANELNETIEVVHLNPLPVLNGNYEQLYLLFYELLKNSMQYKSQHEHAKVAITVLTLKRNHYQSLPNNYDYRDHVKISVADNSEGFDAKYNDQVFNIFSKLHLSKKMGLGLAYCKLIVENHGGTISASSQQDKGNTIVIEFPADIIVRS